MFAQNSQSRQLLAYAWRYKVLLFCTVILGILGFSVTFIFPWLIGTAMDRVISPPAYAAPIDAAHRLHWLVLLVGIGLATALCSAISSYGRGHLSIILGNRVIADLRSDLFDHLNRLSLHFYSRQRTGCILSRLINDVQQASQIINNGMVLIVLDVVQMVGGLVLLLLVSWQVTLACLVVMPFYALTFRLLNPRVRRASARVQSQISHISGTVQERLAGVALVKTSAAEDYEREIFRAANEEYYGSIVKQSSISHLVGAISDGLIHTGTILLIATGGYLAIFGAPPLSGGDVIKLLGWLGILYGPIHRFAEASIVYQTSMGALDRVFRVFRINPKIVESRHAIRIPPHRGEVRYEGVRFHYADDSDESRTRLDDDGQDGAPASSNGHAHNGPAPAPRWVLDGLNFAIRPGERVALVGRSGSGKSTLVSLLPRLYDVTEGRILIDGVDVREYALHSLRQAIGVVQQQSLVFSGTIRDNLCYGITGITEDAMIAAARAANAEEFISRLPDKYSTRIGERGVNLSGGQVQRLSIARALLRDPRILILDEATNALDAESEALVQDALDRVMHGRTCFIIAHRLSTVRNADRILVLDSGRIVESGTHDSLVARGGLYAQLASRQFDLSDVLADGDSRLTV